MNSIFLSKNLHENPEYSTDNFLESAWGGKWSISMAEPYFPDNVYGSSGTDASKIIRWKFGDYLREGAI